MHRTNTSTLDQAQSIQKDAIISTLKKELYEIQDHEHQFISLNDEITNVQSKHAILLDQKQRIQNQHKLKIDINRQNINKLRTEIDAIKIQIHKCSSHIDDMIRENAGIKRMCENRENQIAALMAGNQELDAKNQQISQENKAKVNKIKSLKDERNRNDMESQRLHKALDDNIAALKSLEKQARMLESSNSKLENILTLAEKDHSDLIEQMRSREEAVSSTNRKLQQLNRESEELKEKTNRLQKECMKSQQEYKNVCQTLESIINKNKDLTKKLKILQGTLRVAQNELDKAILQRDALENDHHNFSSQHRILNSQIDKILIQIIEYEKINKDLQKEVENYIDCDEQARAMLNRKDAMKSMLDQVIVRLTKTGQTIAHLR